MHDYYHIFDQIVEAYQKYHPESRDDVDLMRKACAYGQRAHKHTHRKSGEQYITHPLEATKILMRIHPDRDTIIGCLLHDCMDDGSGDLAEIESMFGSDVAHIVTSIHKIGLLKYRGDETSVQRFQKGFVSFGRDVRVLFVKFAERIHNLQTLIHHEDKKTADRIAYESLLVYAPVAARLGLYFFKNELEKWSFKWLEPQSYDRIVGELADLTVEMDVFITQSISKIQELLPEDKRFEVTHRVKQPYSIFRKMRHLGVSSVRDVYDVFALRILTESVHDCYHVLGLIHGHWKPVLENLDDYIGSPKPNGYQSLHTTVLGLYDANKNRSAEIQIRTFDMHERAEYGVAAHFSYKEGKKVKLDADWIEHLGDSYLEHVRSGRDLKHMDHDTCPVSIFVFTPKGDVKELAYGSCVIDFAYAIHSDVGHTTVGARVNNRMVPITTKLRNGDLVEIMTDTHSKPSLSWLEHVVTHRAKHQIMMERKRISGERDRIIAKGKELVNAFLFRRWGEYLDEKMSQLDYIDGAYLTQEKKDQLLYIVGMGRRRPSAVFRDRIGSERQGGSMDFSRSDLFNRASVETGESHNVIVGGQKDMFVHFSGCCRPRYPAMITGVIRRDGTCSVHRSECSSLARTNPARRMDAYWETLDAKGKTISFQILDVAEIEHVFVQITQILYDLGINILEGRWDTHAGKKVLIFLVEVHTKMEDYEEVISSALTQKLPQAQIFFL